MNNFKLWLSLCESQTISSFLKNQEVDIDAIKNNKSVVKFIKNLSQIHPAPLKKGTQGVWVRTEHQIPIVIKKTRETSVILEKQNGKPWNEILHLWPVFEDPQEKKQLVLPVSEAKIIKYEPYKIFINWFAYMFIQSKKENIDKFLNEFLTSHSDELETWAKNYEKFKTTDSDTSKLKHVVDKKESKRSRSNRPGPEGKTLITFPDGWKWVDLEKGHCGEEGDAAGHCGNTSPYKGDNILSLRDDKNHIHMTVVVNNGVTSEMKSPGNRKPKKYTHPYVVELLKHDSITNVGPGRWQTHDDFKLSDLNQKQILDLHKNKPELINFSHIENLAVQASGNQSKFQSLVIKEYGLPEFKYTFDYNQSALKIDYGTIDSITQEYKLNKSDYPSTIMPSLNPKSLTNGLNLLYAFWDSVNLQYKKEIWQKSLQPNHGEMPKDDETYLSILHQESNKNKNIQAGVSRIWTDAYLKVFIHKNNLINKRDAEATNGFYVILNEGNRDVMAGLYLLPEFAEEYLKQNKKINVPKTLEQNFSDLRNQISYTGFDEDWEVALHHAMQNTKNQFWKFPIYDKQGNDWSQELRKDKQFTSREDDFKQQQRDLYKKGIHPMQIASRNEHEILPNLENKYMHGGIDEYIQELKKKGWWEPYVQWAKQNYKFIPQ